MHFFLFAYYELRSGKVREKAGHEKLLPKSGTDHLNFVHLSIRYYENAIYEECKARGKKEC